MGKQTHLALRARLDSPIKPGAARPPGLHGHAAVNAFRLDDWGRLGSLDSLPWPDPVAPLLPPVDPQQRLLQAWRDLALATPRGAYSSWWLIAPMDRSADGLPLHPAPTLKVQLEHLARRGLESL